MLRLVLQVLRKRLQGVTARLGSEVKDGGVAREAEDAVNELQRQMGEFERSVQDHQKTLDMTCRLQEAMEEVKRTGLCLIKHEIIIIILVCVWLNLQ